MNTENTIPELITNRVKKYGSKILFQRKDGWSWKQVTWLDFEKEVKDVASFLLELGFEPGNSVLTISRSRLESLWAESAIYLLGGVIVPVSEDESSENILRVAKESGAKFIFAGSNPALDKVRSVAGQIPGLEKVVSFPDVNIGGDENVIPFKGLLKFGAINRKKIGDKVTEAARGVSPTSPAAVFYGSNSNGWVEKRELTQRDIVEAIKSCSERIPFIGEEDQALSHLSSVGSFEKFINYLGLYMGIRIVVAETRGDFFEDILEVKPTVIFKTRDKLEGTCREVLCDFRKSSPIQKLRGSFGGRIKYIVTDSLPVRGEMRNLFSKSGISLVEVPEIANL